MNIYEIIGELVTSIVCIIIPITLAISYYEDWLAGIKLLLLMLTVLEVLVIWKSLGKE